MALSLTLSAAALLLLLLATPLHVHLAFEREQALRAHARITWLFGLVRLRLHPSDAVEGQTHARRVQRSRSRRAGRGIRLARRLLRPELLSRALAFLRGLLCALRPREVQLHARIGLDDPADTGQLWGVLGPLCALLPSGADIRVEPAFDEACLHFRAAARLRLVPGQLLALALGFLLSPPVLRAMLAR